jgi:5-methylcytosine-specific restriction endonuclease McrA
MGQLGNFEFQNEPPTCSKHNTFKIPIKDKYRKNTIRWRCSTCQLISNVKHRSKNKSTILKNARLRRLKYRMENPTRILNDNALYRARKLNAVCNTCKGSKYAEKLNNYCYICLITKATQTDHVIPLAKGGKHCNSNFKRICSSCNQAKNARWWPGHPEWDDFIRIRRELTTKALLPWTRKALNFIPPQKACNDL